jgi:hypothetical protein
MYFLIIKQTIHLVILRNHRYHHLRFFNWRQANILLALDLKEHHDDALRFLLGAPNKHRHQLIRRIMHLDRLDIIVALPCHQGFHR